MKSPNSAYLAAPGFEQQLAAELGPNVSVHGRLFLSAEPPREAVWAQNTWFEPQLIPIKSIGDAAQKLRAMQRNWAPYSWNFHRRMQLIQEQLPHISAKPFVFPTPAPTAPMGSYTLLDKDLMLASARCQSAFANGELPFVEDHVNPPSRAYLKLWEAFTHLGVMPKRHERCLELGASPGGWTWVLAPLGCPVLAVDRAELDARIMQHPQISFRKGDAFSMRPDRTDEKFDWIFSDVICYPGRMLELVRAWLETGRCQNFVITLKFQGDTHYDAIDGFRELPGGRVMHLWHNKHELTWMRVGSTT